jgi:hypothetical protein
MPTKVKKIDNKYRVVDPDGTITKNLAGTAVDGGGFATKAKAEAQSAAINISSSKKKKKNGR